jgi:predicted esterase
MLGRALRRGAALFALGALPVLSALVALAQAPKHTAREHALDAMVQVRATPLDAPLPAGEVDYETAGGNAVHVWPPAAALAGSALAPAAAPVVVMLHGMCSDAVATCAFWNQAAQEQGWLVCPDGNARCGDGDPDWRGNGETKAAHIDAAVDALRAEHPRAVAADGDDILVGFSRGAFVARDVAYARPGRYRGLVLLGAALKPDPKRLRDSGIRRVVLGAGDFDGSAPTMRQAARLLERGGLEARFVSLGPIYHALPGDLEDRLREAFAWIRDAQ